MTGDDNRLDGVGVRFDRFDRTRRALGRFVFGDRRGLAVFLLAVVAGGLLWRVGIFITDTYTVANAFVAVTEGHLSVEQAVYGESLATPGMHVVDGELYGRNYGQLALSLPTYWLLARLSALVDPGILLAALWSVSVLGLAVVIGPLLDRRRTVVIAGSLLASAAFLANVAVATDLDPTSLPLAALQLTGIVAAGLLGVTLYRLVSALQTRRVGVAAGVLGVLGTPVSLWASIPKRHVFTTLFPLAAVATLALSRTAGSSLDRSVTRRRWTHALAYAFVGLTAWIHAAEGLLLLIVLVVTDLLTGDRRWRPGRTTAAIALVLTLSIVPLAATNVAISGDPLEPPRELPAYNGGDLGGDEPEPPPEPDGPSDGFNDGRAVGPDDAEPPAAPDHGLLPDIWGLFVIASGWILSTLRSALEPIARLGTELLAGLATAASHPSRVYHTFLRSGYLSGVAAQDGTAAISLTVLESMPLLGGVLALPVVGARRLHRRSVSIRPWLRRPAGTADVGLATYGLAVTLLYLPRLPLHAQVTVRYLLPVFPIGLYFLVRTRAVRRAIDDHAGWLWSSYAVGVCIGGQLLVVAVATLATTIGEAFQLHAVISLALAGVVALATSVATVSGNESLTRPLAMALGFAAAATTAFVVFVSVGYTNAVGVYPGGGDHALALVRLLAETVALP
ncbi:MAG: hypothetical protein ABEJ47_05015 [Halorhabdus sp.]